MKSVSRLPSKLLTLSTLFSLSSALSASVLSFDPVNNPHASPLGTQSYGYTATLGGTFVPDTTTAGSSGLQAWTSPGNPAGLVGFNSNNFAMVQVPVILDPVTLTLKPGRSGEYAVIRIDISPLGAGTYDIAGSFWGQVLTGTTTDVHLLRNGTSVFDGIVNGFGPTSAVPFAVNVSLNAGDTLDFAVGNDGTRSDFDFTGLTANFTAAVPEPTGLPLLTLTGLLMFTRRRMRPGTQA